MENSKVLTPHSATRINLIYLEVAVLTVLVIVVVVQHKTLMEVKKLTNQNNEKK